MKCPDITLSCFITTLYYCAHPSTRCLNLALPLGCLCCDAGITTFGDRRIKTPSPSLDLSTLLGGQVTQLGSRIWSSFGLQNSFPHITINSHSHCFLCVHLCHHLLLLYFPEPCIAQISSFPDTSISSISLYQHPCGSHLSVNLQVALLGFFLSMVFPVRAVHFEGWVFGPWSHQRPFGNQPPFLQTSIFWFLTWGKRSSPPVPLWNELHKRSPEHHEAYRVWDV